MRTFFIAALSALALLGVGCSSAPSAPRAKTSSSDTATGSNNCPGFNAVPYRQRCVDGTLDAFHFDSECEFVACEAHQGIRQLSKACVGADALTELEVLVPCADGFTDVYHMDENCFATVCEDHGGLGPGASAACAPQAGPNDVGIEGNFVCDDGTPASFLLDSSCNLTICGARGIPLPTQPPCGAGIPLVDVWCNEPNPQGLPYESFDFDEACVPTACADAQGIMLPQPAVP
jgi:hypothetical protein